MMLTTVLQTLVAILEIVEIAAVTAVVLIGTDLGCYYYQGYLAGKKKAENTYKAKHARQTKLRLQKEQEAAENGGFFEGPYIRGFGRNGALLYRGCQVLTEKGLAYYKIMQARADKAIFDNTEVL